LGDLPTVAKTKSHFFKAIVDYGVLGFTPSRWPEGAVEAHIRSYETLLEKDGRLFLKWDMFWPKENPQEWDKVHRQLLESMIPHSAYLANQELQRRQTLNSAVPLIALVIVRSLPSNLFSSHHSAITLEIHLSLPPSKSSSNWGYRTA
jgi:hypothetical protein